MANIKNIYCAIKVAPYKNYIVQIFTTPKRLENDKTK